MGPGFKIGCGIAPVLFCFGLLRGQSFGDSLVYFSDLKYHSEFEARSFQQFAQSRADTFNLLMAIDEGITDEEAREAERSYNLELSNLIHEKKGSNKIKRQIRKTSLLFHDQFLKEYDEHASYPVLFETGRFNCASASMLYSQALDRMEIPYKVMVSSNHVYLVANPGKKSVVIETTKPSHKNEIVADDFKHMYVNYMRENNLITEADYENKSVEEIFEESYDQVMEANFLSLPGIQYYNIAFDKLHEGASEEAFELAKKAYYYFPDERVKNLLYHASLLAIQGCDFQMVTDMDYLVQYARFENADQNYLTAKFGTILKQHMQFVNKEDLCKSMYKRLISQIPDSSLRDELSFTFYLRMSYENMHSEKLGEYITEAVDIKNNHKDANLMFESFIRQELSDHTDFRIALDSIRMLERRYGYDFMEPVFSELKSIALLRIAEDELELDRPEECERYLTQFEEVCYTPVKDQNLKWLIEMVYRKIATYYYYTNRPLARKLVERGLTFVPGSNTIKSAVYKN